MSSYSFQYIRRRPHIPITGGNPFAAEWKLIDGIYSVDEYSQLRSVKWMYKNTPHGDRYLADLRKYGRMWEAGRSFDDVKDYSVGRQIDVLLSWSNTANSSFYSRTHDLTIKVYDV